MVFDFMGFAQLMTPGQVIDVKLSKIAKFCLKGHIKKFYNYIHQSYQSEKEACFLVLRIKWSGQSGESFIVIPVNDTGQFRSILVTNCHGIESRT